MILFDTQVLVWLVLANHRLGRRAVETIVEESERRISPMTSWEVAMTVDKRRLLLEVPLEARLAVAIGNAG